MTEDHKPLRSFFAAVMAELKKRLTPAEYTALLKECQDVVA